MELRSNKIMPKQNDRTRSKKLVNKRNTGKKLIKNTELKESDYKSPFKIISSISNDELDTKNIYINVYVDSNLVTSDLSTGGKVVDLRNLEVDGKRDLSRQGVYKAQGLVRSALCDLDGNIRNLNYVTRSLGQLYKFFDIKKTFGILLAREVARNSNVKFIIRFFIDVIQLSGRTNIKRLPMKSRNVRVVRHYKLSKFISNLEKYFEVKAYSIGAREISV